jgi:ribosomal RNA-processing protein 36
MASYNLAKLISDIRQIPLSTLMKAQKSLRVKKSKLPMTDMDKLSAAKARLAEMQQMKGKGKAILQEAEESESDSGSEEGARRNKHAYVHERTS